MGVSVFGGAVTTFISGAFLMPSKVEMFYKFGVLITTTAFFSFYFSMIFFASLMNTLGPQNNFGDVKWVYFRLKEKLKRK